MGHKTPHRKLQIEQTLIKTEMNSAALEEQVVPALLVASVKTQVISHE